MKSLNLLGGDNIGDISTEAYSLILYKNELAVNFIFNGVRVIMFPDETEKPLQNDNNVKEKVS